MTNQCKVRYTITEAELDRWIREGRGFLDLIDGEDLRCDYVSGHPGPHLADVQFLGSTEVYREEMGAGAKDDSPWWFTWHDGTQPTVVIEGKRCEECTLPEGHPSESGCGVPEEPRCDGALELTPAETDRMNDLDDATDEIAPYVRCELAPAHDGPHSVNIQESSAGLWWVVWEEPEARCFMTASTCDVQMDVNDDDDDVCLLLAGHGGAHRCF